MEFIAKNKKTGQKTDLFFIIYGIPVVPCCWPEPMRRYYQMWSLLICKKYIWHLPDFSQSYQNWKFGIATRGSTGSENEYD